MTKNVAVISLLLFVVQVAALPAQSNIRQRRFAADSFWVGVWQRGYTEEPDLVVEPRDLAVVGNRLIVLDAGTREVLVVDATTGKLLRKLEARGSGPGEFKRPGTITAMTRGFGILDQENQRFSALSLDGKLLWDAPAPGLSAVACAHSPTAVTWKTGGVRNAVVVVDSSGRTTATRSLPWTQQGREELSTSAVAAGPSNTGTCVFARRYGNDFVLMTASGAQSNHKYIENVPEPQVVVQRTTLERSGNSSVVQQTERTNAVSSALRAMVVRDTLIVLFAGATNDKYRLLDYYHLPSGQYVYSRRLRAPAVAIASSNGVFFVSEIMEEYAGFFALKPSYTKPSAPKKAPAKVTHSPNTIAHH